VTEFSKTFLVFYKWLNLTDVQVIVHSRVCLVIFVCCEHAYWYFYHFLVLQVNSILRILNLAIFFFTGADRDKKICLDQGSNEGSKNA
jgi:hypothetical protein